MRNYRVTSIPIHKRLSPGSCRLFIKLFRTSVHVFAPHVPQKPNENTHLVGGLGGHVQSSVTGVEGGTGGEGSGRADEEGGDSKLHGLGVEVLIKTRGIVRCKANKARKISNQAKARECQKQGFFFEERRQWCNVTQASKGFCMVYFPRRRPRVRKQGPLCG